MARRSNEEKLADLLESKRGRHAQMHQQWVSGGKTPELLKPLLQEYSPLLDRKAQEYGGGARQVDPVALRSTLTRHFIHALETYDPSKAGLNTHVQNVIQKGKRQVIKVQNVARIPEEDAYQIGKIQRASAELEDQLGALPTAADIAKHTGLAVRQVARVQKRNIADIPSGGFESDPLAQAGGARHHEILPLIRPQLSPRAAQVFDLIYHPTSPVQQPSDIAQRLRLSGTQVSRAKSEIEKEYKRLALAQHNQSTSARQGDTFGGRTTLWRRAWKR